MLWEMRQHTHVGTRTSLRFLRTLVLQKTFQQKSNSKRTAKLASCCSAR
jgi:hypothetical protein